MGSSAGARSAPLRISLGALLERQAARHGLRFIWGTPLPVDHDAFEARFKVRLVIRPREPAIMASHYVGMPEETCKAWRNLWFHTGDLARLDAEGDLHFCARMTERIRVKGEMVSAYEVEEIILMHESVRDCAVLGIPDGSGEESVKAFVTLRDAARLDPAALIEFCRPRMSRYMLPAAVEFIAELPRTPTGKVAKAELAKLNRSPKELAP